MTGRAEDKQIVNVRFVRILFGIYLLFLAWAILGKFNVPVLDWSAVRAVNFIPFNGNNFHEMAFNTLCFGPFGLFLSILAPRSRILFRCAMFTLVSIAFEALQYALALGIIDVTDVILNTAGGILGILLYRILCAISGKNRRRAVLTTVCILITITELAAGLYFSTIGNIMRPGDMFAQDNGDGAVCPVVSAATIEISSAR
jgi:glycopeptide antibiotics resistance protein